MTKYEHKFIRILRDVDGNFLDIDALLELFNTEGQQGWRYAAPVRSWIGSKHYVFWRKFKDGARGTQATREAAAYKRGWEDAQAEAAMFVESSPSLLRLVIARGIRALKHGDG